MIKHELIVALVIILVEFRVAKFETIEIKLGTRNVIIPLNGPVHVKRFKSEELANLKVKVPDLVELVAKVQGLPLLATPKPPTPRLPLPPDRYQLASQFESQHPHPSNEFYSEDHLPNHFEYQLPRNYKENHSTYQHFSEYPQQEYQSKHLVQQQMYPLPYREFVQPIHHPVQAGKDGTQHYTLNHSYLKPNSASILPQTAHTAEQHFETKAINGIHPYKEEISKKHTQNFNHVGGHSVINKDTKSNPQNKASNHNYNAVSHELTPYISKWIRDHEVLENIKSEQSVLRDETRTPSLLHRPRQRYITKAPPTQTSGRAVVEDTAVTSNDSPMIAEKEVVTSNPTSTLKDDEVNSHFKPTLKKSVLTSPHTSIYEDHTKALHSIPLLTESVGNSHSAGTTMANIITYPTLLSRTLTVASHPILISEEGLVIPKNTSKTLHKVDSETKSERNSTIFTEWRDIVTAKTSNLKTADRREQITSNTKTTPNVENTRVHLAKQITTTQPETQLVNARTVNAVLEIDAHATLIPTKSNVKDLTINIPPFSEQDKTYRHGITNEPIVNLTNGPFVSVSATSSFHKHDTTTNTAQTYTVKPFHAKDSQTDVPVTITPQRDTITQSQDFFNKIIIGATSHDMTTESLVKDTSYYPREIYLSTIALNTISNSNVTDSATNAPSKNSLKNVTTTNSEEMSTDVTTQIITTLTTSQRHETGSKARENRPLMVINVPALSWQSHMRDSTTNAPKISFFENDTLLNSQEISTHIGVDKLAINTATEIYAQISTTDVQTKLASEHDITAKNKDQTVLDIFIPEYGDTTESQDVRAYNKIDFGPIATDISTQDDIKLEAQEIYASLSTDWTASNTNKNENTTNPQESYLPTKAGAFTLMTITELTTTISPQFDTETNENTIDHSTSRNTLVLGTITEPHTQNVSTYDKSIIQPVFTHITTDESVINGEHLQVTKTNITQSSFEDDTNTNIEGGYAQDKYTTTEISLESTERLSITLGAESVTEKLTFLPLQPATYTTVKGPTTSPSPQNKTPALDAVATRKSRPCKRVRKKACGSRKAVNAKRQRRRKPRTTLSPIPDYSQRDA